MKFLGYEIHPRRLLCFFGIHNYSVYMLDMHGKRYRVCFRCGRFEIDPLDRLQDVP